MNRGSQFLLLALVGAFIATGIGILINLVTAAPEKPWRWIILLVFTVASGIVVYYFQKKTEAGSRSQTQGIENSNIHNSSLNLIQAAQNSFVNLIQIAKGTFKVFIQQLNITVNCYQQLISSPVGQTREDIQNREMVLTRGQNLTDRLLNSQDSIYHRARIALGIESQPTRIKPYIEVAFHDHSPQPLPDGTRLIEQLKGLPIGPEFLTTPVGYR